MNTDQELPTPLKGQYALWQIMGIWLAGGAPLWVLGWLVYPAVSLGLPLAEAALLRIKLLTLGLVWEFVLAMIILYYEEGNIRWGTLSRRFWLSHPRSARTGETKKSLWWWVLPLMLLVGIVETAFKPPLANLWAAVFPLLAGPKGCDLSSTFTPGLLAQLAAAWSQPGLILVNYLFFTVLGEEFLFRGVLLPKMEGMFGRWDWLANGVIFGFYHLHQPWGILPSIMTGIIYAGSSKRTHNSWFSIILHAGQGLVLLFLALVRLLAPAAY